MDEPKHPTYGTLEQLLAEIGRDVRQGYDVRIGLQGALAWFTVEFGRLHSQSDAGAQL